ncbi:hypothetical protein IWQ57_000544 [Coemansia nantahalensis]|uniref:Uncharacterized protein n=2 Tax=Coemansia TaxID=4863 RepID=A0ACC1L700_9FUNG|nr:hypothetical protein IWQ57_000544 [Coemansia nantahalensis]KAJ2802447.1 hypothetical protein H4R21_002418 [Coemansia helicoidea]
MATPTHIVVAGGNYAGLNAMRHLYSTLLAGPAPAAVHLTMIDRRDGFLHYVGMTRGLTDLEYGEQLWVPYAASPWLRHPQITVKQGTVVRITDRCVELAGGEMVWFDYLVLALGVARFAPIGVCARTKRDFVHGLAATHAQLAAAKSVAVIGGGAVGIELAADIKSKFTAKKVALVHSRAKLLPGPFLEALRDAVADILEHRLGVRLVLGRRVVAQDPVSADMWGATSNPECVRAVATAATLTLDDNSALSCDLAIRCLGVHNRHALLDFPPDVDITGPAGIRVRPTMQVDDDRLPHIYACGDICDRYQIKLAGVAIHGAYIAARNIARAVLHPARSDLDTSVPRPVGILLLLGHDHSVWQSGDTLHDEHTARMVSDDDMTLARSIAALSLLQVPAAASPYDQPSAT